MTGNSFNGLIEEFPGLSIDRFNNGATTFLLSHYHSDHLVGLDTKSFLGTVYCLEVTKSLLKRDHKYGHVLKFIRALDYLKQHFVLINGTFEVKLSLIPAYHCEGAVCFLIESPTANVFCTGDVRAETTWLNALTRNPFIFPYTTKLRTLDNLYFDSTFEYRREPYIEIPSNNDGIQMVVLILLSYPKDDPQIKFSFVDTVLGFEEAWINIARSFDATVHMNDKLRRRVESTGQSNMLVSWKTGDQPCFHVGCKCPDMPFTVRIKQCIDFNAVDYIGNFLPIPLSTVALEKLSLQFTTEKGNKIYLLNGHQWLLPRGSSQLLPATIKMVFSRHSSYSECCRMISKLRPRQVYPCSDLKVGWLLGFQMSRLFGKFCECPQPPSPRDFKYDRDGLLKWGPPLGEVRDRTVKAINRWDLESCKAEYEIAKRFMIEASKPHFEFKGQHWVSKFCDPSYDADDSTSDASRKKDMKLQDLIIGRGERAYRKIIEDLQRVYIYRNIDQGKEFIKDKVRDDEVIQGYNRRVIKLGSGDEYNYDQESCSELFGLNLELGRMSVLENEEAANIHQETNSVTQKKIKLEQHSIFERDTEIEDTDIDEESNCNYDEAVVSKKEAKCFKKGTSFIAEDPDEVKIIKELDKNSCLTLPCHSKVSKSGGIKSGVQMEPQRKRKRIERTVSIESPGESFELSIYILVGGKTPSNRK